MAEADSLSNWNAAWFPMRVLAQLFPFFTEQAFFQDLFKEKKAILDAQGNRLLGSEPYDQDERMAVHFATT